MEENYCQVKIISYNENKVQAEKKGLVFDVKPFYIRYVQADILPIVISYQLLGSKNIYYFGTSVLMHFLNVRMTNIIMNLGRLHQIFTKEQKGAGKGCNYF